MTQLADLTGAGSSHVAATLMAGTARIEASAMEIMRRDLIERTVAAAFEVEPELLRLPTRGSRRISRARQVAMYLAHVSCRLSFTDIGRVFGRDRSTVAHACTLIEQRRDDDEFDQAIELLEGIVGLMSSMWPPET